MIRYSRFIALGDSFTEGVGDIQIDGQFMGWADRVAERLADQQPDFSFYNLAIRGKLVSQVIEDQIPEAMKWIEGSATLLSFHAGANDVLRPGYDPDVVLPQYREAVRKLAATGAQLLLFTAIERVAKSGKMQELWRHWYRWCSSCCKDSARFRCANNWCCYSTI
jgi:lysophospholipase L1-like esterase